MYLFLWRLKLGNLISGVHAANLQNSRFVMEAIKEATFPLKNGQRKKTAESFSVPVNPLVMHLSAMAAISKF